MPKPYVVHLIKNPIITAKFDGRFPKLSEIHVQEWAIASLLTNAFCSAASERFLKRLFAEMGFVSNNPGMATHAMNLIEKMANEAQ